MRLMLIYAPSFPERNWPVFRVEEKNGGLVAPLSLLYVAAIAEKAGHEVSVIDIAAERLSIDEAVKRIKAFSPDLLGFTMTTYMFHQTLSWIRALKKRTGLPILVGGQHLGLYPKETMTHKEINFAIIGEAELTLPNFLAALEKKRSLKRIRGLIFRQRGRIILNPPQNKFMELDKIPFPARHLLDMSKYYTFLSRKKNFTPIITTRGCPFRCIFCDYKKDNWRIRSAKNVVDEIEECYRKFGVREVYFYDSAFTANRQRVLDICQELRRRKLDICWSAQTRIDCVDKKMLQELSRSGCVRLMYGIESADPLILKTLRKGVDIGHVRKVVNWTKQCGVEATGFFIIGSPGETKKTAQKTINFSLELPLDWAQFNVMTPFPATELYQMLIEDTGEDYWRKFVLDPANERQLPLVRTSLSLEEAQNLVSQAYRRFYFRPRIIISYLKKVGSFFDLYRTLRVLSDMIRN